MKRMIIFNGSPRRLKTSYRFAEVIADQVQARNVEVEILHIIDAFHSQEKLYEFFTRMARADYVGLVTPLYVDYLPYPVLWFMEESVKQDMSVKPGAKFFAVAQCGFPDVRLLDPILGACQIYAKKMNLQWLGGIGYGGGAILDGIPMGDLGKRGAVIIEAFSKLVEDILGDREIRDGVQKQMNVDIPIALYRPMAMYLNHRSKSKARKNHVHDLWAQPYK